MHIPILTRDVDLPPVLEPGERKTLSVQAVSI